MPVAGATESDIFTYAEGYDEVGGRYRGLRAGQALVLSATDPGVVVKAEVARRQLDAEVPTPTSPGTGVGTGPAPGARIAEEVIAHLAGLPGAEVLVTLEIEARLPQGASEHTVRTVTENCRTLKFVSQGFENE